MNPFSALSEMATRSSIYKRHETRCNSHNGAEAGVPIHPPHQPIDTSLSETLMNLNRRSTIYNNHDVHHHEMRHDPHAGQRHMIATMASSNNGGFFSTLARMTSESSIYDRNARRNQFLHQNA